ncbi:MAG: preprotein translocase subunit SecE [Rickettsiales bacterium]
MKVIKFFNEVKRELSKITWLKKKEAVTSTLMVVVVVLIFALLFVVADFVIYRVVQFLMNLGV